MGTLRQTTSGRSVRLSVRHLVGRATRCDLLLPTRQVSGEHAIVVWDGQWRIRDLGSSNGTFVDGERLALGQTLALRAGATLCFGGLGDPWVLVGEEAPPASATSTGLSAAASEGLLALPDREHPVAFVFQDGQGHWVLERLEGPWTSVRDGQTIELEGRQWLLRLPESLPSTWREAPLALFTVGLRFEVSRDEEHVTAWLLHNRRTLDLGSRAHHYTLLTLARARVADQQDPELPPTEHGWLYQDDLVQRLGVQTNILHTHIFRARRQLAELGVMGAAAVVERRAATGQLRLGVEKAEIYQP